MGVEPGPRIAFGGGWICLYAATCASRIPRQAFQRNRIRYVRELLKATSSRWMRDGDRVKREAGTSGYDEN